MLQYSRMAKTNSSFVSVKGWFILSCSTTSTTNLEAECISAKESMSVAA